MTAKIALFSKLSNFYFDLMPTGKTSRQDRVAKTRLQAQLECADPRGSPGGWSGLELTDTLYSNPFLQTESYAFEKSTKQAYTFFPFTEVTVQDGIKDKNMTNCSLSSSKPYLIM